MNKVCQIAVAAALSAHVGVCAESPRPMPVTYIMVCCHEKDKGTKFLANGEWPEKRDYRNYPIALGAKEYAVIGTYDDTCDSIFWGIADVSKSRNPKHVNEATKNDPYVYYNIVKEEIAKWRKQQPVRK